MTQPQQLPEPTTPVAAPATPTPTAPPAPITSPAPGPEALTQPGILAKPRPVLLLAALAFMPSTPADRREALERLRLLVADEQAGERADPVVETGELGYDNVSAGKAPTITVALSSEGYVKLGVPSGQQPADLVPIPVDIVPGAGQLTQPLPGEGDLLLHVQADDAFVTEHVLRRVERDLVQDFTVVWAELAAQRDGQDSVTGRTGRSLLGFLDGTSNLNPDDPAERALIVLDHSKVSSYPPVPVLPADPAAYGAVSTTFPPLRVPPSAEDQRNDGGSYLAVQVNFLKTVAFDHTALGDQERVIGRYKRSGVSLDLAEAAHQPTDYPDFVANPTNPVVPFNSHVRKANPRRMGDSERRILRRGYPLVRRDGATLARGLAFVAFARSLSTQFEFITRAWLNNPNFPTPGAGVDAMSQFVLPAVCGGYYFAPPLQNPAVPESWYIPAAP